MPTSLLLFWGTLTWRIHVQVTQRLPFFQGYHHIIKRPHFSLDTYICRIFNQRPHLCQNLPYFIALSPKRPPFQDFIFKRSAIWSCKRYMCGTLYKYECLPPSPIRKNTRVFSLSFWGGGDLNFFRSPSGTKSNGGGGFTKNFQLKPKYPPKLNLSKF